MENKGFLKVFSIVAFVALMIISCWATTESLHLLLPHWPVIIFWIVTVAFFVLSALGTKLIVDSCNKEVDTEHPGRNIAGGIIMLLLFWVVFSIPTNTHTFFYKATIQDVLTEDLNYTKSHLRDLANDQTAKNIINNEKEDFNILYGKLWNNVAHEIKDENNPGWGEKAIAAQEELDRLLGVTVQIPKLRNNTKDGREELVQELGRRNEEQKQFQLKKYDNRLAAIESQKGKKEIEECLNSIIKIQNHIKKHPENNDEPTLATEKVLKDSYDIIARYMDDLQLQLKFDKKELSGSPIEKTAKQYKANVSQTANMRKVTTVWKGLLAGEDLYKGRGLWYWVIVAIMIDLAGFIFFDIAFRKREY